MAVKERKAPSFDDIFDADMDMFDFEDTKEEPKKKTSSNDAKEEAPKKNESLPEKAKSEEAVTSEEKKEETPSRQRIPGKITKKISSNVVGKIVENLVNEEYLKSEDKAEQPKEMQSPEKEIEYHFIQKKTGEIYSIRPGAHFTIGADPSSADLLIEDNQTVSRRHAEITVTDDGTFYVKDIGSRNGTKVNGENIGEERPHIVNIGDLITFSDEEFIVSEAGK